MSNGATSDDSTLGRRALITGAAVLGAAGVASIAAAPGASAADGSRLVIGRQDNEGASATRLTVGTYRRSPVPEPPGGYDGFVVHDKRASSLAHLRAAVCGIGDTGVLGSGHYGLRGVGTSIGVLATSDSGYGVKGEGGSRGVVGTAARAAGIGVEGTATSTGGTGVKGIGDGVGVVGQGGAGVHGTANSSGIGVRGASTSGVGVQGMSASGPGVEGTSTSGHGVAGTTAAITGVGVIGTASHATGITQGVRGDATASPNGTGVTGLGQINGVYGESRKIGGRGVYGYATQADGEASHGVYGKTNSSLGAGVYGQGADDTLGVLEMSYGVYADGAIASSGPAFLGVPEYGSDARVDGRLKDGTMTFSADFTTASPKLLVYVKNTDGRTYRAELPLTLT